LGSQPVVVQSVAGHSAPWHGRQVWLSQISLASQSPWPLPVHPVLVVPHTPLLQVSPSGHAVHVAQLHSTAAQTDVWATVTHASLPLRQSPLDVHGSTMQVAEPPHTWPNTHALSSEQGVPELVPLPPQAATNPAEAITTVNAKPRILTSIMAPSSGHCIGRLVLAGAVPRAGGDRGRESI